MRSTPPRRSRPGAIEEQQYGRAGRPFNRRAPFYIGLTGALGVAVAAALAWTVIAAGPDPRAARARRCSSPSVSIRPWHGCTAAGCRAGSPLRSC